MSGLAIGWAFKQACPSRNAKLVLLSLANHANGGNACWQSFGTIAEECGIARRHVPYYVKQLVAAGLIAIERRSLNGGALSNGYVLAVGTDTPMVGTSIPTLGTGGVPTDGGGVSQPRHPNLKREPEEEDSHAPHVAAEPPAERDPVKELWDRGLRIVGDTRQGRGLIGKARREHGDEAVMLAILACESECPTEPLSFFLGCLKRAGPRPNGLHVVGTYRGSPHINMVEGFYLAAEKLDRREEADRRRAIPVDAELLDGK